MKNILILIIILGVKYSMLSSIAFKSVTSINNSQIESQGFIPSNAFYSNNLTPNQVNTNHTENSSIKAIEKGPITYNASGKKKNKEEVVVEKEEGFFF